jgi:predicted helicase
MMTIDQYIQNLNAAYQRGTATEHTYRGDLKQLIEAILPNISATNEPKRIACGAPDYVLTNAKDIPVGFIEAKDIGDKDLSGEKKTGNKEQFDRYKTSLNNLIFTDYIDFHLYVDGIFVTKIAIAELKNGVILPLKENFATFTNLIKDFSTQIFQSINSPKKLAEMMAGKARLLANVIEKSLISDEISQENSTLKDQLQAFKEILIHDITAKDFADVYAQTIAYGMFAARVNDKSLDTFSRQKAAELIPKSNPFLRKLFSYIAGIDLDDRIKWIVDNLVEIFLACDVLEVLKNYGKATKMEDPIIHFYETFLSIYDPELRKTRAVWYTPAPVVNFIVRAVDDILKTEFNLPQGLADTSKITPPPALPLLRGVQTTSKMSQTPLPIGEGQGVGLHKVQILDPATGTGTFLAEVVKQIHKNFVGREGIWNTYVENHLLPRLNGFELLMASYAMAHLQMDLLLKETGFKTTNQQRLRIFLSNSLEEGRPTLETGFANWLSIEANEARKIKRETPVMCIVGNPPYLGESANKGEWIMKLMEDYKKEPEGKQKLQERNPKWLNDDYVKFLRYGQHFIEKNGSGILAFINPHGFLDNPTFRGMRWNLLKTYDKIYTIDLHGNSKKKETALDGSKDENVFDIMQGVSINIFVKTGKKKSNELAKVFHYDLFGKRQSKFDFLKDNSLKTVPYKELPNITPNYFFVPKDFEEQKSYDEGFKINELFVANGVGITTAHDEFVINKSENKLLETFQNFQNSERDEYTLHQKFKVKKKEDWNILQGYDNIKNEKNLLKYVKPISYRLFDKNFIFYEDKLVWRTVHKVMQNFFSGENLGLVLCKQFKSGNNYQHCFISNKMIESSFISNRTSEINSLFPLYIYETKPKQKRLRSFSEQEKLILLSKLEQAKEHYKQIDTFFKKTVLPFYNAIKNPSEDNQKLFEENKSTLEEAKATVEKLEKQLEKYDIVENLTVDTMFGDSVIRTPNLNKEIVAKIATNLGLTFTNEKETSKNTFAPIDLLDYIYAVLHSPTYREKYKEFLKIDFPRVPYPTNLQSFQNLVNLGSQLRQIHLLESQILENSIITYPINGTNKVEKVKYFEGKVFINDTQHFTNVSEIAWEFYIGGYQPAQKWLKDRKDGNLEFDDILHYQKIIVALTETDRLMKEIDGVEIE